MTPLAIGLWSFPVLLGLIALRLPVGLAMFATGFVGLSLIDGSTALALARLKSESYSIFASYPLSIIPMFLLMGAFATQGGLSDALFHAARGLIGHRRGGLAMAAIGASAGFGAICGSSLATAATMGRVALPQLRQAGYGGGFAGASLAAGGTLGILIPPSIVLVLYALLTEQNIAKLFAAALIPGLMAAGGYMAVAWLYARRHPDQAPASPRVGRAERLARLWAIWPVIGIFALVMGGIYGGIFTPTEAAAIGALGTGAVAWAKGRLGVPQLTRALFSTARNSAMIFLIIFGAAFFNGFLALAQVPQILSAWILDLGLPPLAVLLGILALYLILGCVMESLSMVVLTVPIFFPIIMGLDFGLPPEAVALWFGILVLIAVETGMITPPVGLNLFVIAAMDRATSLVATWRAVIWFIAWDIARIGLILAFPSLVLVFWA